MELLIVEIRVDGDADAVDAVKRRILRDPHVSSLTNLGVDPATTTWADPNDAAQIG